jgi:hypothetical protein
VSRAPALKAKDLVGRLVRLRYAIETRSGTKFAKGEVMMVEGWWRRVVHLGDPTQPPGSSNDRRHVRRVELEAVEPVDPEDG